MSRRRIFNVPRSIYCFFSQVLFVLTLASLAVWFGLRPKTPIFTIANLYFPTQHTKNSAQHYRKDVALAINTSLLLDLEVNNPNKGMRIYYDRIRLRFLCNGGVANVDLSMGYTQGCKKTAIMKFEIITNQQLLGRIGDGKLHFSVHLDVAIKYRVLKLNINRKDLHYGTYLLSSTIALNGTLSVFNPQLQLYH